LFDSAKGANDLRIANPRYGRLPVCATGAQARTFKSQDNSGTKPKDEVVKDILNAICGRQG
jgi:hypothetical protein